MSGLRWTATGPVWEAEEQSSVPQWNSLEYQLRPHGTEDLMQYAQRVGETVAAYVTYKVESALEPDRSAPINIIPPTIIEGGQEHGRP